MWSSFGYISAITTFVNAALSSLQQSGAPCEAKWERDVCFRIDTQVMGAWCANKQPKCEANDAMASAASNGGRRNTRSGTIHAYLRKMQRRAAHALQGGKSNWRGAIAVSVSASLFCFLISDVASFQASTDLHMAIDRWHSLIALAVNSQSNGLDSSTAHKRVELLDCNGLTVGVLAATAHVDLENVSEWLWKCIVAKEDKRFFHHAGVDAVGILRAILSFGTAGGGSTVTQQLVKNEVLASNHQSISRKLMEIVLAFGLEMRLNKKQVLSLYLSRAYFGHGLYGAAAASYSFFNKHPMSLNLGEAALLVAMLPAPELYSPFCHPKAALDARNSVIYTLRRAGYISTEESAEAQAAPLPYSLGMVYEQQYACVLALPVSSCSIHVITLNCLLNMHCRCRSTDTTNENTPVGRGAPYRAPHFVDAALQELQELLHVYELPSEGELEVHTTVDMRLQQRAETALRLDRVSPKDTEAACAALDPSSGAVRALVGSREYRASPFNRATSALRSAGSVIKPIIFLVALADGVVTPNTRICDEAQSWSIKHSGATFEEYRCVL